MLSHSPVFPVVWLSVLWCDVATRREMSMWRSGKKKEGHTKTPKQTNPVFRDSFSEQG